MQALLASKMWSSELSRANALVSLARWLRAEGYAFAAPTPATHQRVIGREAGRLAENLRDVFGWSRPFNESLLPVQVLNWMLEGEVLQVVADGEALRSAVRYSTLEGEIFMHSAWPTLQRDAVFFGPDTYRFARYVQAHLPPRGDKPLVVCDVGCGSGAVGLIAAKCLGPATQLHLVDINPAALETAHVNAELAAVSGALIYRSDLLAAVRPQPDLVICNPPYLPDAEHRAYRDGGGQLGSALALRLVQEAIQALAPGGRLLLYTGTAVIAGQHVLARAFMPMLQEAAARGVLSYHYEELDPDVFGEELDLPHMAEVERIAVVGLLMQMAPQQQQGQWS